MNRVLSFPQRHSCDDPAEAVSKRFCISCIFSVSFISLIIGYLLGSRQPAHVNVIFVKSERDYLEMLNAVQFNNKSIDFSPSTIVPSSDYPEVTGLRDHFQENHFDRVSKIFTSKILLTFRDESRPDTITIVEGEGGVQYHYRKDIEYPYTIPSEPAAEVKKLNSSISGLPIYGNFGTDDDFKYLDERNISVQDHIVILRLGRISIFEKVARALSKGAKGVLLFADSQQHPQMNGDFFEEDLSPLLITRLKKFQETFPCGCNCTFVVQLMNNRTAKSIMKDMDTVNASPDSWLGSLSLNYSIGPGFTRRNWKLVVQSNYICVNFTSYDIAGYLRGTDEPDKYVIVSSSRKSLDKSENLADSTNRLMEVSKALLDLRRSRKWVPTRTVVFLSTGLEGLELYGNSWMQKHVDIIKYRTVAYLNIKSSIRGSQCDADVCPVLETFFSNLTLIMKDPPKFKHVQVHDIEDINKAIKYRGAGCMDESLGRIHFDERVKLSCHHWDGSIENIILSYFGIPTISFRCMKNKNSDEIPVLPDEETEEVEMKKYRSDVIRMWSFLTFSLTFRKILPFNFTTYSLRVENYNRTVSSFRESDQYLSTQKYYAKFSHSLQNLTFAVNAFQGEIRDSSKSLSTNRTINEKLMQMQKLFTCVFDTYDIFISHLNKTSFVRVNDLENELITGEICAAEIEYYIRDPYY